MYSKALPGVQQHPQTTVGVLTEQDLLCYDTFADGQRTLRSTLLPLDVTSRGELLTLLWQANLRTVWVMPSTHWSRTLTRNWFEAQERHWMILPRCAPQEPDRLLSVLLWPTDTRHLAARQLLITFPEAAGWPWQVADGTSLLATLTYLERVLARPLSDGPASLASQLLTDLVTSEPSTPVEQATDCPPHAAVLSHAQPPPHLAWMRPLTRAEQQAKYLHCYSHLSLALEACLQLNLPAGNCTYSSRGRAYDGKCPGLWRVQIERAGSVFDGKHLPAYPADEWMTTPQVHACQAIGYRVQVHEGFAWSRSQPSLQPWAQTLWQAAQRVAYPSPRFKHLQGRANTAASIAQLVHLGLAQLAPEQPERSWHRPEWWQHIIGGSRAVLFAHLARLVKRGVMPVLLDGDALWVVSDDPRPLTAVPGLLEGTRWHGYHVKYPVPLALSRDVRDIFHTASSPARAAALLNALAHEEHRP